MRRFHQMSRYMVWGKQTPAADSLAVGGLPLGLASGIKLRRDIAQGQALTWHDVEIDEDDQAMRLRREMEAAFARPASERSVD